MSLITGIQKYSIHDGDGIRTTVFFKGCHLNCQWCHNPETKDFKPQMLIDEEKCLACGSCIEVCPQNANRIVNGHISCDRSLCISCGVCLNSCPLNIREVVGQEWEVGALFKELKKDEMFYEESGGGVTLSGGEVMANDMDFVCELAKKLYRYGISVTIDTCGMAPWHNYERILPFVDTFLYDVKVIDEAKHKEYIGASNKEILSNLEKLNEKGAKIFIRIPVIKEVNGNDKDMGEIIDYLKAKQISPRKINLLPYHNTGSSKYGRLGEEYKGKNFKTPAAEEMQRFVELFQSNGFNNVKIGG